MIKNRKAEAEENAKKVSIPTTKRTSRASLRNASKKDEKRIHISSKKEQTKSEEAPKPKIRTRSSARVASSAENSPKDQPKTPKCEKSPKIRNSKSQKISNSSENSQKGEKTPKVKKKEPEVQKSVTFAHENPPVPVRDFYK